MGVSLLGGQVERGKVVQARPIVVLVDRGESDDKILAVQTSGPLSDVVDLESLESRYKGALPIIKIFMVSLLIIFKHVAKAE